jgi:hypothetical protein
MKTRNGFVSNSSSSSFVLLKDAITLEQKDMILNCEEWIDKFIKLEALPGDLKDKFEYYDSDPWRLEEHEDYIFGETSMDNFSMGDYLNYIKINNKYISWDEGYNNKPYQNQLDFIKIMKKEYNKVLRKKKLKKINKNDK